MQLILIIYTNVALRLVFFTAHSDGAALQQRHQSFEVALIDDTSVIQTFLGVFGIELLIIPKESMY